MLSSLSKAYKFGDEHESERSIRGSKNKKKALGPWQQIL